MSASISSTTSRCAGPSVQITRSPTSRNSAHLVVVPVSSEEECHNVGLPVDDSRKHTPNPFSFPWESIDKFRAI